MFERFAREVFAADRHRVSFVQAGAGPPLLLLHGFPQTRAAWHRVAPRLAERFRVIVPDLPGYGESEGPPPDEAHEHYSKRAVGSVLAALMRACGFDRFAVVGHDRGGRVAYRMALDEPDRVARLAVLDVVPTLDMAEGLSHDLAMRAWNWFLLAQPAPFPETLASRGGPGRRRAGARGVPRGADGRRAAAVGPWQARPWVTTTEGRAGMLGARLERVRCETEGDEAPPRCAVCSTHAAGCRDADPRPWPRRLLGPASPGCSNPASIPRACRPR